MRIDADSTIIGRLRARSDGDELAARVRLGHSLARAELRPTGLSPTAVLCVRRLRDPHPGALAAPGSRAALAWQESLRAVLDKLARSAVRPAREWVPPDAEAVLFADRAEMLACLIGDHCDGLISTRWWWQGLFRGGLPRVPVAALLDSPEDAPATLGHLADRGYAVAFVSALSAVEVDALLGAIIRRFGLSELGAALKHPTSAPANITTRQPESVLHEAPDPPAEPPPWQRWAPEIEHLALSEAQSCLLGIGIALHRMQSVVRSGEFAATVRRWRDTRTDPVTRPPGSVSVSVPRSEDSPPASVAKREPSSEPEAGRTPSTPSPQPGSRVSSKSLDPPVSQRPLGSAHNAPVTIVPGITVSAAPPTPAISPETPPPLAMSIPGNATPARFTPAPLSQTATPDEAPSPLPFRGWVDTEFGGLFYLVNVALLLELYGDFTSPLKSCLDTPLWDFIAVLGRELVGEALDNDPLTRLLARLAGREEEQLPAVPCHAHDGWRLPLAWQSKAIPESSRPECWLDWLTAHVRARLVDALDVAGADVGRVLCRHQARVFVTATRLDVNLSLSELPIAVRVAGLDRDPGWVPAAGYAVAFHFE